MENDDLLTLKPHHLIPSPFGDLTVPFGTLGPDDDRRQGAELTVEHLRVRLGDRPVAYDLRELFMSAHGEPPDTVAFNGYDIWLIVHAMGVVRTEGTAQVEAMGYEAVFSDERSVYTVDLLPRTEFISKVGATLQTRVDLGIEGTAGLPLHEPTDAGVPALLAGNVSLLMSHKASILGRLSFSLTTPVAIAVGKGSSRCQWHFEKADQPLLGDQTMVQTVLVPRRTKKLDLRIRGYAMVRPRFLSFAARHETDWVEISCPLVTRSFRALKS